MKQMLRKHGKNWEISPPQGGHQACPCPTFHWAHGGRPPGAGPTTPRHPGSEDKGPHLWKMVPQSVSSLGNPHGTCDLGGPTDESEAMRQANQDGNLPTSEPWNHALRRNQPIGDAMMIPKPGNRKRTRFCMQNPNDIQVTLGGKWKENCRHQQENEVDWMGHCGSDLNKGNNAAMQRVSAVFGQNSHKMATSHPNRESSSNRKPGDTMALVAGWPKDKVFETGNDPCGRWVHTKIRSKCHELKAAGCNDEQIIRTIPDLIDIVESITAKKFARPTIDVDESSDDGRGKPAAKETPERRTTQSSPSHWKQWKAKRPTASGDCVLI